MMASTVRTQTHRVPTYAPPPLHILNMSLIDKEIWRSWGLGNKPKKKKCGQPSFIFSFVLTLALPLDFSLKISGHTQTTQLIQRSKINGTLRPINKRALPRRKNHFIPPINNQTLQYFRHSSVIIPIMRIHSTYSILLVAFICVTVYF